MSGFLLQIGSVNKKVNKKYNDKLDYNLSENENYTLLKKSIRKFKDDKIFYETDSYLALLDGVILNKKEIKNEFKDNWENSFVKLYEKYGENFFNHLRGSFFGVMFDKNKNKWIIFVDQLGSKPLFYSSINGSFVFSSEFEDFKDLGYNDFNVNAAYMLLSFAFMLGNSTMYKNVYRVEPGKYAVIEDNKMSFKEYYKIDNTTCIDLSEDEIIEKLDDLFRKAVKKQFDKDLEYGYNQHMVALSGGLDSRMTAFVAHDMGYVEQLNFTYSQAGHYDEILPKQMSSFLKTEWIYKSLDNGVFLKNLDTITKITGGNIYYAALSSMYSMLNKIDSDKYGIIHTGQFGDNGIAATYSYEKYHVDDFPLSSGAYNAKLAHKINYKNIKKHENVELFKTYYRFLLGMNYTSIYFQKFTETLSPFSDLDFVNFVFSIPVDKRYNSRLYHKWILTKYPDAAKFIWAQTGMKINAKKYNVLGREYTLKQWQHIIMCRLGLKDRATYNSVNHMNPFGYWMNTNKDLNKFVENYYLDTINLIKDEELRVDVEKLFEEGNAIEKFQVISLLSSIKYLFD